MTSRRAIRELALQVLYQLDARAGEDDGAVELADPAAALNDADHAAAVKLAQRAYGMRRQADELTGELAPTWPATRQPAVDRALLRLGYCEMVLGDTPAKVAINEAIELAKVYSTDKSPAFVNGVLDKMMRRLAEHPVEPPAVEPDDPWLADALNPGNEPQS